MFSRAMAGWETIQMSTDILRKEGHLVKHLEQGSEEDRGT